MKTHVSLLVVLLITFLPSPPWTTPFSDFETGTLEGWTKVEPFNGDLLNKPGGAPGRFLFSGDTMAGGGGLIARAPSSFSGDLSGYDGIWWSEYLYPCSDTSTPTYPRLVSETTIYVEKTPPSVQMGIWRTRYVPFSESAWVRVAGSASFAYVLSHVSELRMNMECNGQCYSESGIDNVSYLGAPPPPPPPPPSPLAVDDTYSIMRNTTGDFFVLDNDVDSSGTGLFVNSLWLSGTLGVVTIDSAGASVSYVPPPGYVGSDRFNYMVRDGNWRSDSGQVLVHVVGAADDMVSTWKGISAVFPLLDNDYSGEGLPFAIDALLLTGTLGGPSIDPGGGSVSYVPPAGYAGPDSFSYVVSDGTGVVDTAKVRVIVAVPDPQRSTRGLFVCPAGDAYNRVDIIDTAGKPMGGVSVTVQFLGADDCDSLIYCAAGLDSIVTFVTNAGGYATVALRLGGARCGGGIVTVDWGIGPEVMTTDFKFPGFDVNANGMVDDEDIAFISAHIGPSIYHCLVDYNSDGVVGLADGTISIPHVAGRHGCPEHVPGVTHDEAATNEDAPITVPVLANDADPDGTPLRVQALDLTGTLGGAVIDPGDTTITYTPTPGFFGVDSLLYRAGYCHFGWDTASVVVSVNDRPACVDDNAVVRRNVPATLGLLANDDNLVGDPLRIAALLTSGLLGSLQVPPESTQVIYTPPPGYQGPDAFDYVAADIFGARDTAHVSLLVNAPAVAVDDTATILEDVTAILPVLVNDQDPESGPLHLVALFLIGTVGSVTIQPGATTVRYVPLGNWNGTDSFSYSVADAYEHGDTAHVVVHVTPVQDPPIAQGDAVSTPEDVARRIFVLANDSDVDRDPLRIVTLGTAGTRGAAVKDPGDTSVTYTPIPNDNGLDTFTYAITDGHITVGPALVQVTITPVNDRPVARPDTAFTEMELPVEIDVLANDTDQDGGPLRVESLLTGGTVGTPVIESGGLSVIYTPPAAYFGIDTFEYVVHDGGGGRDTARVTVVVAESNRPPVARDDIAPALYETPLSIPVLANDYDPNSGDRIFIIDAYGTTHGMVSIDPESLAVTYAPEAGYKGMDTFIYTIADTLWQTASAVVTLSVTGPPDPRYSLAKLRTCPSGEIPSEIEVRDEDGFPIAGPLVIVDFPGSGTLDSLGFCTASDPPSFALTTGTDGRVTFYPAWGGVVLGGVRIRARMNEIEAELFSSARIISFDLTGDLEVGAPDVARWQQYYAMMDPRADLNGDGRGNAADLSLLLTHVNHACNVVGVPGEEPSPIAETVLRAEPNPFRDRTALHAVTARDGTIHVAAYDLRGRIVRRIAAEPLPAGSHVFHWDGRSDQGEMLPVGIYFIRMEGAGVARSIKVLRID